MPGLNPSDYKISAGELNRPVKLYNVNPSLDSVGGVVDPASEAVNPIFAWNDMSAKNPYQGVEIRDAQAKLGEEWARFVVRYQPSRFPKEGMRIIDQWDLDEYEITGVQHIGSMRLRVELTCRKLK